MSTLDQINDFTAFAKSRLGSGEQVDIDRLYDEWRSKAFGDIDALAIQASIRDLESGERGEPLDEFLANFEQEQKQDRGE
ncbi:MAG: hypothetical protein AAGG48_30585 [Planctomycetota bacterium]